MTNGSPQSTILVKKADGSSVRMTMEELQAYKKSQTAPVKPAKTPTPVKPVSVPAPKPTAQSSPVTAPKPAAPQIKKFVRPAPPSGEKMFEEKWEADDNKSLLDDSMEVKTPRPFDITHGRSEEFEGRQAESRGKSLAVKPAGAYMPTTSVPVKDIFVDEAKYKTIRHEAHNIKPEMPKIIPKQSPQPTEAPLGIPTLRRDPAYRGTTRDPDFTSGKPLIQDVKPPQIAKQSIGPIDELANFSLVDFRRLEINSKAAGLKLLEKFNNLKEDSYLLFIEAVKAWYNSPLYRQYQEVLYQSLAHGKSVNEILLSGDVKKDLKFEEFKAILGVNEAIS